MKISIAMATYNGEHYVAEQINSILHQTNPPDEIVIVDDASSDNTVQNLSRALEGFSSAKIIENKENRGYSSSFFTALSKCTGDIILIADQDDFWEARKIEVLKSHFDNDANLDLVIHDAGFCDVQLNPIGNSKYGRIRSLGMSVYDVNVTGMSTAISGKFMKVIQPKPDEVLVSYDEWIHICAKYLGKKKVIEDILVRFRRHEHNATIKDFINTPTNRNYIPALKHLITRKNTRPKNPENYPEIALRDWIIESSNPEIKDFHNSPGFERLDRVCGLIRERLRIRKMRLYLRFFSSISFFWLGGYREFRGYRSFLKDLIS
jgi:glycosyltransferase involved in cell wall biosynthesis